MQKRHLSPAGITSPFGRYHHLVEVVGPARLIFLSGQLGTAPDGTVPDGVAAQAELAFAAIDRLLTAADLDRSAVVRLNVYLTDMGDRAAYMAVRDRWVADPPPASTLLGVAALALPACRIEIEAVAAG